jgi:hypothetical protein
VSEENQSKKLTEVEALIRQLDMDLALRRAACGKSKAGRDRARLMGILLLVGLGMALIGVLFYVADALGTRPPAGQSTGDYSPVP